MTAEQHPIDITNMPELDRLATEVAETGIPRALRRGDTVVAKIVPVTPPHARMPARRRGREKTPEDIDAFLASAGSWSDVDVEQFKKNLYKSRRSSRPPVRL